MSREEKSVSTSRSTAEDESNALLQDFPEGGFAGWSTAIGAFLVQFCTHGYLLSFGVYQNFYTQTYITSETPSTIAWIGSTNAFLFEICGLLAGRMYDRGYFYYLLYGASFLQAFSLVMLSLARPDNYYQIFLVQGIASGCAAGMLYVPSMAVLSHYFDKRRAQAMTFASSGAYFGAVVHPIMLNNTINGQLGFAIGVRTSAGLVSVLLLIACLLMRTRLPPSESRVKFVVVAKKCGRDSAFIFGCLGLILLDVGLCYPLFYLQLDVVRHGLGNTFSFYSLVIMNASSFVGQLSSTFLVGYLSVPTMTIVASFSCSVILFGMIGVHTLTGVVIFGVLYGYFAGTFLALWTPVVTLLTPDISELGVRMGVASAATAFSGLVGPPIFGALLTPAYIWRRAAVFAGITTLLGGPMFVVMRFILARRVEERLSGTPSLSSTTAESAGPEPSTSDEPPSPTK